MPDSNMGHRRAAAPGEEDCHKQLDGRGKQALNILANQSFWAQRGRTSSGLCHHVPRSLQSATASTKAPPPERASTLRAHDIRGLAQDTHH